MYSDDPKIEATLTKLTSLKPRAIFLYGSRGRGDFTQNSDYELGVVFDADSYVERARIHELINDPVIKAYPFKWEELATGSLSFLFQKSLYLRELKLGAKQLYGDDILAAIPELPITTLDLVQRTRFDIGMALAAMLSYRAGDIETAMEEFTKSCLLGVRSLAVLESGNFIIGYENIYEASKNIVDDADGRAVIEAAIAYRRDKIVPPIDIIFDNIALLDSFIEPKIIESFNLRGSQSLA